MQTSYANASLTVAPTLSATPRITPTRRSLDKRFPQLAFTIQTGGKPYFEVLLTTESKLFDAQQSAARTPDNFFPAGAEERRLLPALGESAVFIVPQAVLHTFAAATPRPKAIYYTVIAYTDASGSQPTFAQPLDTLTTDAPSVLLSADFNAETLSSVLGVPVGRLRRYQAELAFVHQPSHPFGSGAVAEKEGDVSVAPADVSPPIETGPQDGYEYYQTAVSPAEQSLGNGYDDGYDDWQSMSKEQTLYHPHRTPEKDAWDDDLNSQKAYAIPQESRFPAGMPEPAALLDAEQPWLDDEPSDASALTYDDGFGDLPSFSAAASPVKGNGASEHPSFIISEEENHDDDDFEDDPSNDDDNQEVPVLVAKNYHDEAEDHAYEEAFAAAEVNDLFEPELPYEPLSAISLGGSAGIATQPLTIEAQRVIIERIARFESGNDGYSAMNRDGEFRGQFGQNHPAYNRYHIGLSYGIVQFTQDSGNLGRLLTMMRDRDQARFNAIFGPGANELIRVTTSAGPSSARSQGGRSDRVQPVGGADLWEEPWISRFRQAGQHVPFQAAQNELAAQLFIRQMLPFARWLGLTTDRALTIVVDRAIQMGVGGARSWIIRALGPIQTTAQRQQALTALGHADLRSFQRTTPGLPDDGAWGPQSHAALVAALRALGSASPIVIPTLDQMLATLVRLSSSERWGHRVKTLRDAPGFNDVVYDF